MTTVQRKRVLLAELDDRLALHVFRRLFEVNQTHDVLIARSAVVTRELLGQDRFAAIAIPARAEKPEAVSRVRSALGEGSETRIVAVVDSDDQAHERLYAMGADRVLVGGTSTRELAEGILRACEMPTLMSGRLEQLSVPDLVQILCLCHRALMVRVVSKSRQGVLWLTNGEIQHAVCGRHRGQAAMNRMISMAEGHYHAVQLVDVPSHTIKTDWQHVLLEAARIGDEHLRNSSIPPPETRKQSGVLKAGVTRYRELTELGLQSMRLGDLSKAREYWKAARDLDRVAPAAPDDDAKPEKAGGGSA